MDVVQEFRYLGSIDSADGYLTPEINKRKLSMCATYNCLKSILLDRAAKRLLRTTMIMVFLMDISCPNAVVMT